MKLDSKTQLFLTLATLTTGCKVGFMASLFGISPATVSRYFQKWILFMDVTMQRELFVEVDEIHPSPASIKLLGSELGKKIKILIDCTEFTMERPSHMGNQRQCYSEYAGSHTAKVLLGISAETGEFCFVSEAFPGNVSDPQIVELSNVVDFLNEGDAALADRGFDKASLLFIREKKLVISPPTRYKSQSRLTYDESYATTVIARLRIHIERAIKRLRAFGYLRRRVEIVRADMFGAVLRVCAALSNFMPRLI